MTWVRYDDALPQNRKVAWLCAHGERGVAALGLHLLLNAWSRHEGMQGFIPSYIPEQRVGRIAPRLVALLADDGCGMLAAVEHGWMINDYEDYGDRDDGIPVEVKKAQLSKRRAEAGRLGGLAKAGNANSKRLAELKQTSSPVPVPVPTTPETSLGGERPETLRAVDATKPPTCQTHPDGNFDGPCGGCKRVREWGDKGEARAKADAVKAAKECGDCGGTGWLEDPTTKTPTRKCDHRSTRRTA